MARAAIPRVLLLRMRRVAEGIERVEDVREDERVDVARPQEVEVFVVRDLGRDGVGREFLQHDGDVDERVGAAVDENDWRFDVAGGELCDLGIFAAGAEGEGRLHVVVVHLEGFGADYLEPVDYAFGAGEGVEVGVGGEFL